MLIFYSYSVNLIFLILPTIIINFNCILLKGNLNLLSTISQILKSAINLSTLSLNYKEEIPKFESSPYLSKFQVSSLYTIHPSGIDIEILSIDIILSLGIIAIIAYLCIKYYRKVHECDFESQIKELYLTKQSRESTMIENRDRNILKDGESLDKTKIQNEICWSESNEDETKSHVDINSCSILEKSNINRSDIFIEEKEKKSKKENEKYSQNSEIKNFGKENKDKLSEKSKNSDKKEIIEKKEEKTKKTKNAKKKEKTQTPSEVNLLNENHSINCIDNTDIAIIPQEEKIIPPSSMKEKKNTKKKNRSKSKNKKTKKESKISPNKKNKEIINEKLKDPEKKDS